MGRKYNKVVILLPLIILIILFYIPLAETLLKGFKFNTIKDFFISSYYRRVIFFTVLQATASALLSIVVALPGAYIVTRYNFPGKKVFLSITSLTFVIPSILTVLGFVLLFGNNGILNRALMDLFNLDKPPLKILYSLKAVLLAHVFYNFPLAIRIISSLWRKIPYELTEASYSLGYGRLKTFFKITLPFLKNGILTSFTLIFLYCFMSFGIILVLGGGPSLTTIEVEVYRFARISLDIVSASALSIIESIITITVLLIYLKGDKLLFKSTVNKEFYRKFSFKKIFLFGFYLIPLLLVIVGPLLTVLVNSFLKKEGFQQDYILTLHWYKSIFGLHSNRFSTTAIYAIRNSFIIGSIVTLITLPMASLVTFNISKKFRFKRIYKLLFFLPMGVSSIIIGLSYLTRPTLSSSYLGIILAHIIITLPLAIRSINNIYKTIDYSMIEASMSLGYSRFKTFLKIEIPLMKSGIITAAIFTLALSIGEMNASIMLAPSGFVTIPLAIYQLIGSYNFMGACALGSILLILSFSAFRLIDGKDL